MAGKIAIVADIHSNLVALDQALHRIKLEGIDEIVVCGDIVGYGRYPNECCELIRSIGCVVIAGNHDWAVAGKTEYKETHSDKAIAGIEKTKEVITPENRNWLSGLPLTFQHPKENIKFVHSSLVQTENWYYLTLGEPSDTSTWQNVIINFKAMEKDQICFVGHSHIPIIFLETTLNQVKLIKPSKFTYNLCGKRAIIDVGSVGYPRNEKNNASFVIYDPGKDTVEFVRYKM
ncbi:MAG: metallophosphoesterase family protein [Thermodesulfobacteriota bacterium]